MALFDNKSDDDDRASGTMVRSCVVCIDGIRSQKEFVQMKLICHIWKQSETRSLNKKRRKEDETFAESEKDELPCVCE